MEDEGDSVVRNCTCCRNVIDPGLICVRQHLKPTTTKELNPCNCLCDEDEEVEEYQQQQQYQPQQQSNSKGGYSQPQQRAQPQQQQSRQQQQAQRQSQSRRQLNTASSGRIGAQSPTRRNQATRGGGGEVPPDLDECPEAPYKPWCDDECVRAMNIERMEACRRQTLQPTFRGEITNGDENWAKVSETENCQRNLCLNDTIFSGGLYSTASPQPCNLINVATQRKTYKCCPNCKPCSVPPEVYNPPFLHSSPQPCRMSTIGIPPETVSDCKETDERAFGMNCPQTHSHNNKPDCKPQATGKGQQIQQMFSGVEKKICPRCEKPVYHAEAMQAGGSTWHKSCYTCACCGTILNPQNIADRPGDNIYCKLCYKKNFGPQGYGYGGGAGTLQIQTVDPCVDY